MDTGRPKNISQIIDEKGDKIHDITVTEDMISLDIYTVNNPGSVVNMMQGKIKNDIISVPVELREMNHSELRELIKPDAMLNQLRMRFWRAYDDSAFSGRKITMNTVTKGVCDPQVFMKLIKDRSKLAFILTPLVNYEIQVQEFMETSLYKMRQGLDKIEIETTKDILAILKLYEVFDKRVHGDYKQNIKKEIIVTEEKKSSAEIKNNIGEGIEFKQNLMIEKQD